MPLAKGTNFHKNKNLKCMIFQEIHPIALQLKMINYNANSDSIEN
jgi:hypothetical protein